MLRTCRYCGRCVPMNHNCKSKPKEVRRDYDRARMTREWKQKSLDIKERSLYLCEVCKDKGQYTYNNLETHHIIKVKDRPDLTLDDSNLICVCESHHEQAECGEIEADYLRRLVTIRDKNNPPGW